MQPPEMLVVWTSACTCERKFAEKAQARADVESTRRRLARLVDQACLDERFREASLDNYRPVPGTEFALDRCADIIEHWPAWRAEGRGLLLVGENGCGKTHLASAIVHALAGRGVASLFLVMPEYFDQLRRGYDIERAGDIAVGSVEDAAANVHLLALDDLAAEKLLQDERGDWLRERMYLLVDRRYRRKLPIIATSNASDEELEARLGTRIFRRLMEMLEIVPIAAGNYADRGDQ